MKNKRIRVVLVDDSQTLCQAMKYLFELVEEVDFIAYTNAIDFLKDYSKDWNGILLMDLLMPGMDGITLLEELRQRDNKMYNIVISGHADTATAAKVKELGAHEFLPKPFNISLLLEKIKSSVPVMSPNV